MRIDRLAVTLALCLAMCGVLASAAQANWTVGEPGNALEGSEAVNISGENLALTGELLSAEFTLTIESVECAAGVECTIDNTVSTNHSSGELRFTGVTADGLGKCSVHGSADAKGSNTVTTEALTDEVIMDPSGGAVAFDKFFADGGLLATVVFEGAECAFDGLVVPVEGSVAGQSPEKTGELKVSQTLTFGAAQQSTGGASLTLGEGAGTAVLDGTVTSALAGVNSGEPFGADGGKEPPTYTEWSIAGSALASGGHEEVGVEAPEGLALSGEVAGEPVRIEAEGMECAKVGECTLDGSSFGEGHSTERLKLTGAQLLEPSGCKLASETITTDPLEGETSMDSGGGAATFHHLAPVEGDVLLQFEMLGSCELAGLIFPLKGSVAARIKNTGIARLEHPLTFSEEAQKTGGGSLKLGKHAAQLEGEATLHLTGSHAAQSFSVAE